MRVHPETGERSLVLGNFVKRFEGLNTAESTAVFQLLQNRITKLENTIRWTWQTGDVAMWDNRATQHYAVADFGTEPREVRRITVPAMSPSRSTVGAARSSPATPTPTRGSTS